MALNAAREAEKLRESRLSTQGRYTPQNLFRGDEDDPLSIIKDLLLVDEITPSILKPGNSKVFSMFANVTNSAISGIAVKPAPPVHKIGRYSTQPERPTRKRV
jgi:hypothetical protein